MFSEVLVSLTGIFLILYIVATSATLTGQPGDSEEQNKTDEIHSHAYLPYQCRYPYTCMRRERLGPLGAISPIAWQNVCGFSNYSSGFTTVYNNKPGNCPDGIFCLDGCNADNNRFISCISESNDKGKGKRKLDPQAGTSAERSAPRFEEYSTYILSYTWPWHDWGLLWLLLFKASVTLLICAVAYYVSLLMSGTWIN